MNEYLDWSATEIARRIAAREVSAREVCTAYIARCEQTNRALNAFTWTRFEAALQDASALDEQLARGAEVGSLAGVPFTAKDCFLVAGATANVGLAEFRGTRNDVSPETAFVVQRLQQAGGVLLGKTNVPQLMLWHECDNPVNGRTNNPWDLQRTPGGSTGGEAAIIAAHGSALGLGNDLGGSIRIPAAWCGVHGLKPTMHRLPNCGSRSTFQGLEAMVTSIGPMARDVKDLEWAMRVLCEPAVEYHLPEHAAPAWRGRGSVSIDGMRIATWLDDGLLRPSAAIERAVREAGSALVQQGAIVETYELPMGAELLDCYVGLMQADGGADLRRIAGRSPLDWRVSRILMLAGLGRLSRMAVVAALRGIGQAGLARLISAGGARTADAYWQLVKKLNAMRDSVNALLSAKKLDAVICPPHALPAPQHGKAIDLVSAASYALLPNLLGWPAGVVSTSTVREDEQTGRPTSRDIVLKQAAAVDAGSAGLPVGVQVFARPWREDIVLAVMAAIERALPRPQLPPQQLAAIGVQQPTETATT